MNKALKVVLISVGVVVVAGAGLVGFAIGYPIYEDWKKDQAALGFPDFSAIDVDEWVWHQEWKEIQVAMDDGKPLYRSLRKVNVSNQSAVYARIEDNGDLMASAVFKVDCEVGSKVETSVTYSDGKPAILHCVELSAKETGLMALVMWDVKGQARPYDIQWTTNYDGFSVNVDFDDWDFTKLIQENTLGKAKPSQ